MISAWWITVTLFQHTAARRRLLQYKILKMLLKLVSTHSRPKAAASNRQLQGVIGMVSTHSRPKAAAQADAFLVADVEFQHTAARRRLPIVRGHCMRNGFVSTHSRPKAAASHWASRPSTKSIVSTHSRPKAAAFSFLCGLQYIRCFNTQPPEGGCHIHSANSSLASRFNTQPPEGGCITFKLSESTQ